MFKKIIRKKISISSKFNILSSLLIVLTALIIALYTIYNEYTHTGDELLKHGRSLSYIIAQNIEYGIYTEDRDILNRAVDSLRKNEDILYVVIYNARRHILSKENRNPGIIKSAMFDRISSDSTGNNDIQSMQDQGDFIDIVTPVTTQNIGDIDEMFYLENKSEQMNSQIGYLRIGLSKEKVQERIRDFIFSTVLFTSLLILFGVVLTVLLSRRITRPIQKLSSVTQRISQGNFDHNITIQTNDEVSDLAGNFATMVSNLKGYRERVESHAKELSSVNTDLIQEIETRKVVEKTLTVTKERLQEILDTTPAVVFSAKPDINFSITFMSDKIESLTGYRAEEFTEEPKFFLGNMYTNDLPRFMKEAQDVFISDHQSVEFRIKNKSGYFLWVLSEFRLIRTPDGTPREIIGYLVDITERKKLEDQLQHDALHDSLTNLPNRALFIDRIEYFLIHSRRMEDYHFAVLFADLDRFKNINDSLGHVVGDKLLLAVSERLKKCLHTDDTVARFGGDEFGIILTDIKDRKEIESVTERIHTALKKPFKLEGHSVFISLSIGITIAGKNYENQEQILRDADTAMYHAKSKGGACHEFFNTTMYERAVRILTLEEDMRSALEDEEYYLCYQPIVKTTNEHLIGFEALVRWNHPEQGLIPPSEFIPLAEDTGLIIPLGEWILLEACRQMSEWQKQFPRDNPLSISVNISGKQLTPSFIDLVKKTIYETGLKTQSLKIEITESILMEEPEQIANMLAELKKLAVQIQIDDFGTGYSSMSYLHRFPIDTLKIDRSFITLMTEDTDKLEVVKTIIALAHNLKMETVAEGVESVDQQVLLDILKCEYLQGYLFSRPLESNKAKEFIKKTSVKK